MAKDDYSRESDLRKYAMLSPEEQARSTAYEQSPANRASLVDAIASEKNPASKAILIDHYNREFGGAPPTTQPTQPSAPQGGLSWREFLASDAQPKAQKLGWREFLESSQDVTPEKPPAAPDIVGRAKDIGISALKGAIGVPEFAVGLADLATGGRAGKAAEELGFRPKEAKDFLSTGYSDAQKKSFDEVQKAEGLWETTKAAVSNPSVLAQTITESVPSMLGGGLVARGLISGTRLGATNLGKMAAVGLGEGTVAAGSSAEHIRQETADGLLTRKQALVAGASGLATGALGMLGAKIAKSLGIADVDSLIAGAAKGSVSNKGLARRVLEGAFAEGILEELPQSVQEQVAQNYALGKPLDEGVNQAVVLGALSGAAMGGGLNIRQQKRAEPPTLTDIATAPTADAAIQAFVGSFSQGDAAVSGIINNITQGDTVRQQQAAQAFGIEKGLLTNLPSLSSLPKIGTAQADAADLQNKRQGIIQRATDENNAYEWNDLVSREAQDLDALRAAAQGDYRKQRELDQLQTQTREQLGRLPDQQVAAANAATVEAPTAMQLAMQRARAGQIPDIAPAQAVAPITDTSISQAPNSPNSPNSGAIASEQAQHPEIQPGDIARKDGTPFQSENGARLKQREAGGIANSDIAPVAGGFVVRPKHQPQENVNGPQAEKPQQIPARQQETPARAEPAAQTAASSAVQPATEAAQPTAGVAAQPQGEITSTFTGKFGKGMGKDAAKLEAQRLNRTNDGLTYTAEEHGQPLENPWAVVGRDKSSEQPAGKPLELESIGKDATETVAPSQAASGPEYLGRNNIPLSEGGKPFKTNRDAKKAKRGQPMLRVKTVPGGFALAPATEAQIAAQEAAAKRLGTARIGNKGLPAAAHQFIAGEGGLNPSIRSDLGIEGNPRIGNRTLYARAGAGLTLEQGTEALKQEGYLGEDASHTDALNLIRRSMTVPQYTPEGANVIAQVEANARFEDFHGAELEAAQSEDFDPFESLQDLEYSLDDAQAAGYDAALDSIKLEVNALLQQAEALGIDTDTIKDQAHEDTRNGSEQDFYEAARDSLKAAIEGSNGNRSEDAGQPGDAPSEGLTAPTREDILAKQEKAEQAERTDKAQKKAQDILDKKEQGRKDIAARSVGAADSFTLGGDAEQNLTGQGGMFDAGKKNILFSRAQPFYSALAKEVASIPAKAQSAMGWQANIMGLVKAGKVKQDEVEWSGLTDWLKLQEGKVTKEQVNEFLNANGVKVTETVLGQPSEEDIQTFLDDEAGEGMTRDDAIEYLGKDEGATHPKYGQYQLPGGTNYREVLLTLPEKSGERVSFKAWQENAESFGDKSTREEYDRLVAKGQIAEPGQQYKSSHWDQPNVLAHIRVNDRVDADGARVLFVEEIQSDWSAQGRKEGFITPNEKLTAIKTPEGYWEVRGNGGRFVTNVTETMTEQAAITEARNRQKNRPQSTRSSVPDAPFVGKTEAYVALALKRVIKRAVDGGYAKVAFINGEQSADRYDLSKQISKINYGILEGGEYNLEISDINGTRLDNVDLRRVPESRLEDVVGKEVAKKIIDGEGVAEKGGRKVLSGLDLKVGGEGMKAFYDKIVPSVTKDVLRKLGGGQMEMVGVRSPGNGTWGQYVGPEPSAKEVREAGFDAVAKDMEKRGITFGKAVRSALNFVAVEHFGGRIAEAVNTTAQPGFTITPAMREKAADGLPLFSRHTLLEPVKTSSGTAFRNSQIVFARPRNNPRQPANGLTRVDYWLRDPVLFAQARAGGMSTEDARDASHVGMLTMDVDGEGQFKSLRNILVFDSKRGSGYGEKAVGAIMQSLPDNARLHLHDILPGAVDFWDKMGAKFPRSDDFMEASLSPQQFRNAYDARTRSGRATDQSQEPGRTADAHASRSGREADGRSVPGKPQETRLTNEAGQAQKFAPLANQSTARALNNELVSYGLGQDWSNAYEAVKLPDALSGIRQAIQTAFGRDVRAVAPTTAKFNIFNGVYIPSQPNAVYLNVAADVGFVNIAGHELWHAIKRQRPDLIEWYQTHSRQFYKDLPAYQARLNKLVQPGEKPYRIDKAEEELEADFLGDSLADPDFLQTLADASPTKFKELMGRIRLWLAGVMNKIKGLGSEREISDVKALQGYLKDVMVAYAEGKDFPDAPATLKPFNAQAAFEKHGGTGDIDESTDITAKSQAVADMAETEGWKVAGRGDKYVVLTKPFGDDKAIVHVRVSDHSNVNRGTHFGETDINLAPDDGYDRDTFADALQKLRAVSVDADGNTVIGDIALGRNQGGRSADDISDSGGAPSFSRSLITGQTSRQHTPAQLAAMKNVGFQVEVPTLKERAQALWKDAGKKMAQGIVDQFAPVKALDKTAYGLLRLAKGASGAFESFLHGGKLKLTDGVYDFDDQNKGGVVDTLLIPLQGEHHDFFRWIAANRAERLMGEGKENLFSPADIAALKTLTDGKTSFDYKIQTGPNAGKTTRDRTLVYADALRVFNGFNKNILDMAEQSGLIDPQSRKLWEHEFYVPFYRVADDADGGVRGMNIKGSVVRQQAFKQLKGGKNALNTDLLDNTLMNWAHLLDASAKNRGAKATIEAAERLGVASGGNQSTLAQMGASINNKNGVVWFMDGGQKRYSLIDDPYLMTAIGALEYAGMRNPVMNAMGAMKHVLTVGVTASPFFKIRNLIRDSVQVIGTGKIGYNPLGNVAQGWKLTDPKSDAYFRLLAGGGTIHFGTMLEGSEAKRIQALVESGVDDATILNSDKKVKAFYRKFIEPGITAYNELGNRGEAVNRAALYAQLVKQGVSHADASLQARDLMDFSMQGSFTSIRFLTQTVPFLNARLQGLYKLGRAAKEDPARMATVIGAAAVVSLSLLAMFGDDDEWKKREEWDRNNYWWFKFGGTAFRIPKPFEIGAIATLAERSFELAFDKEMTGKRFRKQVMTLLGDNLSMNPVPQLIKPVVDIYANKDSFSGRPIESMSQEKLQPEYRFNDRTSMFARGASTAANTLTGLVGADSLSPVQIDHMLRGYFGWLGTFIVGAGDIVARPLTNQPAHAAPDYWKAATGGMVSDMRDAPSRYVSQMYEQAKEIEQAYGTYRQLVKEGKTEEAREFAAENKEGLSRYHRAERVKKAVSRMNERIRMIERSNIEGDAKRDLIRTIQNQKDQVARALN